ncbi:MAG: phage Gp37/Gp68 family protein [Methylobacterium sp.]|nr:phage Gp37/Gp68 family protein [Methylobacterium sp.]
MADRSNVEWTDATWTPIRAKHKATGKVGWHCTHATPGCVHCYAEGMNKRLGTGLPFKPGHADEVELFLDEQMLLAPLRWKKPRMIFVCSMTDLFADFVPDEWIDRVFAVMALTPHHTYQVLTKRSARMRAYLTGTPARLGSIIFLNALRLQPPGVDAEQWRRAEDRPFPLPNVWLGVSAEDQRRADERIPDLLATPAAIRFVSAEPLLGPIDFRNHRVCSECENTPFKLFKNDPLCPEPMPLWSDQQCPLHWWPSDGCDVTLRSGIDWIIVGGESGREARPMHPDWARQIRDQCAAAGTAFFFKQWGEFAPLASFTDPAATHEGLPEQDRAAVYRVGKKRAGRLLDGVQHDAMPEGRR